MSVRIVEVGPRDGLQNEAKNLPPEVRTELCDRLSEAGVSCMEAVSFVNPKLVPQMAGAEEVMEKIDRKESAGYAGLVLNERGYDRAIAAKVDEARYAFPVTEEFARRNQNSTVADSIALAKKLTRRAKEDDIRVAVTLSVAFGCPFEGEVKAKRVFEIAEEVAGEMPDDIILADTIGVGVPSRVRELVEGLKRMGAAVGCHFHDTRHTGIANAVVAVERGAEVLDSSVGGTGGCPFAPKATGNISTEDLVYTLHGMGYDTGINLDALIEVAGWLSEKLEKELPGRVYKAGNFPPVAEKPVSKKQNGMRTLGKGAELDERTNPKTQAEA